MEDRIEHLRTCVEISLKQQKNDEIYRSITFVIIGTILGVLFSIGIMLSTKGW